MSARVLFVTGKGGTGKSTVAAALAREAAARGTRVLLFEMPAAAETPRSGSRGRRLDAGSSVRTRTFDERRDLQAFLSRVLGLGFVARRLGESRTFAAVAAAAPGLRDLVALGAIAEDASRRRGLVVVDAPATGHSVPMLTAPSRVLELATIGPVAREARRANDLIADPASFAAVLVTTPEELAITEVLSLAGLVAGAGVASSHVVVNAMWPAYVGVEDGERIAASGVSSDAAMHWRRRRRQAALVEQLERRAGRCEQLRFSFSGGEPPPEDVAALLDALGGTSS